MAALAALALALLPAALRASEVRQVPRSMTISPSELRPGMKGYGLSVFRGEEIERFDVEVVSVVPNALPKTDMILIMCSGQNLEYSKVVAGMSGSPIFFDGRLAGALAYGWTYSRDPLAGVTPIGKMIGAVDKYEGFGQAKAPPAWTGSSLFSALGRIEEKLSLGHVSGLGAPANDHGDARRDAAFSAWTPERDPAPFVAKGAGAPETPSLPGMTPIATPLAVSGLSPSTIEYLAGELEPYSIIPVAGGGMGELDLDPAAADNMAPGSALGGVLVGGDVSMAATGTMTWREGDNIIGFGHPFLGAGPLELPLTSSYIHTIVATHSVSFKMGSPAKTVGALVADELPGIVGIVGVEPRTVPFRVNVTRKSNGFSDSFDMEMAEHPIITPLLAKAAMMEAIKSAAPAFDATTVKVKTAMTLQGHGRVSYEDIYAVSKGNFTPGFLDPIMFFATNPFERVQIDDIVVDLVVEDELEVAALESMWCDTDEVEPGGTITLGIVARPYGGDARTFTMDIAVPKDISGKSIKLKVTGGNQGDPDRAMPRSVSDMIGFMNSVHKSNRIVVSYQLPGEGVDVNGERLSNLPPSVSSMLTPNNTTDTGAAPYKAILDMETPYVVVGSQGMSLPLRDGVNGDTH